MFVTTFYFSYQTLMEYSFTIYSYIEFITALAALSTVILLWRFKRLAEVKFVIYLEILVALWATTYAFEFGTPDLQSKIFWSKLSYFGIAFLPLVYYLFTTAFSQKNHLLSKRNIILLLIIPAITLIMALSNDSHRLIWSEVTLDEHQNMAIYKHGLWFWVFYGYSQIMIIAGLYNLISSVKRFTAYYRTQIITLIVASLVPVVANFIYVSRLNPFPGFDWTPVSFVITGLIIALGVMRFRMFDLVPLARNKLIDTMEDGVLVLNKDGLIEDCNAAIFQIFNLENRSIIKKKADEVFMKFSDFHFFEFEQNDKTQLIDLEIQNETKYYQVRKTQILNQQNEFSGILLAFYDVTKIIKAEIELKEINKQLLKEIDYREELIEDLDSFSHTVAHDLKNSLGAIYSSTEVMMDCIKENDKELLFDLAELIRDSAHKAVQITQELLILATSGHQEVELVPVKMGVLVSEAIKQLKDVIDEYQAEIVFPEKWPLVLGYPVWIEEVWKNLINNAIKYGGNPPRIVLGSDMPKNNKVKFWVKDNGDGINPDDHQKLFKKYSRLNPNKAEGYGLGLSIVKRVMEKLKGEVGVESEGIKGKGAVFYFTLRVN